MNNDLNEVLIEGILTEKPKLTYQEDIPICKFNIAVNRRYKNKKREWVEETCQFNIKAQNNLAEICSRYLKKGRGVRVIGILQELKKQVYILAEHVEFRELCPVQ